MGRLLAGLRAGLWGGLVDWAGARLEESVLQDGATLHHRVSGCAGCGRVGQWLTVWSGVVVVVVVCAGAEWLQSNQITRLGRGGRRLDGRDHTSAVLAGARCLLLLLLLSLIDL